MTTPEPTKEQMIAARVLYDESEECISEVDTIETFARFLAARESKLTEALRVAVDGLNYLSGEIGMSAHSGRWDAMDLLVRIERDLSTIRALTEGGKP